MNKNDAQAVRADYEHGFAVCAAVAVDIGGGFVADGCAMAKDLESWVFGDGDGNGNAAKARGGCRQQIAGCVDESAFHRLLLRRLHRFENASIALRKHVGIFYTSRLAETQRN